MDSILCFTFLSVVVVTRIHGRDADERFFACRSHVCLP